MALSRLSSVSRTRWIEVVMVLSAVFQVVSWPVRLFSQNSASPREISKAEQKKCGDTSGRCSSHFPDP